MRKLGSVFIEINHVVTFSSERYDLSCVRVVSVGKACESEVRDSLRRSVGVCVCIVPIGGDVRMCSNTLVDKAEFNCTEASLDE